MKILTETAEKYGGTFVCKCENDIFTAIVTLSKENLKDENNPN